MHDVYFTYGVGAVLFMSAVLYVMGGRRARSERVENFGGSVLLGKGVMNWTYWMTEPVVKTLVDLDVTANMMTWTSLVLGLGAAVALGAAMPGLACLLATISTIGDILDGQIARHTHTGSARGELLDAAVDRYTEVALVAGFIIEMRASGPLILLGLFTLQACMMISYSSAKAEALRIDPPRGLMRRHERAAYLIVGIGLASLLRTPVPTIVGFAIVAVIGNIAAIQRLSKIAAELR